jgi:hypothetical protein
VIWTETLDGCSSTVIFRYLVERFTCFSRTNIVVNYQANSYCVALLPLLANCLPRSIPSLSPTFTAHTGTNAAHISTPISNLSGRIAWAANPSKALALGLVRYAAALLPPSHPQGGLLLPEHPADNIWLLLWLQVLAWAAGLALVGALVVS